MKRLLLLLLFPTLALAQTVPNGGITQGQVWTVPQWVSAWQSKADTASPALTGTPTIGGVAVPTIASPAFTGTPTVNGIAIPTYPRTAAEISASVTPTDYTLAAGNVLRYGADRTGAADSTTAIQNAINSWNGNGGTVFLPAGTFKINSLLTVPASNTYILGAGIGATTLTSSSATAGGISFSGAQNQGIADLLITSSITQTAGSAVTVSGVRSFTMERLKITNAFLGINIVGGVIQYYTNLEFINTVNTVIYINGGNDQFLKNIVADAPPASQPVAGIRINKTDAVWMDSVDMIHSGTGLLVDPQGATDYVAWLFISNSAFDTGSGIGISLAPANASAFIKGTTISGSWTATNTTFGFNISGVGTVDGVRVVGHRSFNNGQSGYFVTGGGTRANIQFNDSDASGNSTAPSGTYSGFDIGAAISGFSITNCRSGQEALFANSQSRGIIINPGASNNYVLMGNDVRGNINAGILDLGSGTTKIVKGNLGYNPIASTAITVTASPFTFTNNTGDTVNVFVTGGTVSSVTVGGNAVAAATNTMQPVPQGTSIVVTYTVAPTMTYLGT